MKLFSVKIQFIFLPEKYLIDVNLLSAQTQFSDKYFSNFATTAPKSGVTKEEGNQKIFKLEIRKKSF